MDTKHLFLKTPPPPPPKQNKQNKPKQNKTGWLPIIDDIKVKDSS